MDLKITLKIAGSSTTVTVEGGADLLENDPTFHTDVDRALFDKLPLESQSSSVSSLVTLSAPGVAADSNGLFHGLGDHAENSFSVDGQPITDQQSKVFSNQIPLDSIQSLEVISGAPPAEFGDKTSLVIKVTTRSGQGITTPHGSVTASYGTFGTSNLGFDLAYGGEKWGNFISVNGLQSGRFLDPPEIHGDARQGKRGKYFRSRRLSNFQLRIPSISILAIHAPGFKPPIPSIISMSGANGSLRQSRRPSRPALAKSERSISRPLGRI